MHTNANESAENFYKNTNGQPVQINTTAEEQFLRSRNDLQSKIMQCKDITLNQMQRKEHRNAKIQQYRDIENRSINTIENQLTEFRQKQQDKFTKIKKPHISTNSN